MLHTIPLFYTSSQYLSYTTLFLRSPPTLIDIHIHAQSIPQRIDNTNAMTEKVRKHDLVLLICYQHLTLKVIH